MPSNSDNESNLLYLYLDTGSENTRATSTGEKKYLR